MAKNSVNGFSDVKKFVKSVMKDIISIQITFVSNFLKIVLKPPKMDAVPNVNNTTNSIHKEIVFQLLEDHVMITALFINLLIWKEAITANGIMDAREFAKYVMLVTALIMMVLVLSVLTHYVFQPTLTELATYALQDQ